MKISKLTTAMLNSATQEELKDLIAQAEEKIARLREQRATLEDNAPLLLSVVDQYKSAVKEDALSKQIQDLLQVRRTLIAKLSDLMAEGVLNQFFSQSFLK